MSTPHDHLRKYFDARQPVSLKAQLWRERAEELRAIAARCKTAPERQKFLQVAQNWEKMAEAESRFLGTKADA